MCQWAFMCDWGGFCVAFALQLIFSGLPPERTESAQSTASGCVCVRVCFSKYICMHVHMRVLKVQVWDASVHPDSAASIFTQYSETWRKGTCFNIYGCGQTQNPCSLSKPCDYVHARTHSRTHWQKCKDTLRCLYTLKKWKVIDRTIRDRTTVMTKLKRGLEILQSIGILVEKPFGCWFLVCLEKIQQIDVCWVWKKQHEGERLGKPTYLIKLMDLPIQTCRNENKQRTVQVWPR